MRYRACLQPVIRNVLTGHMVGRHLLVWWTIANVIAWTAGCTTPAFQALDQVDNRCGNTAPSPEELRQKGSLESLSNFQERAPGSVTIPVYFHILTSTDGQGLVTKEVVLKQLEVLNNAFAGRGKPGYQVADTPFRFEYADMDVTPNDAWFKMAYRKDPTAEEKAAKEKLNHRGKSSLNIYTAKLPDRPYGWARWPWDIDKGVDGIVVSYATLPGGQTYPYDEGDTVTHEVGHWLGLFHTFENGCDEPGDSVGDTAPEAGPATGCPPLDTDSCHDDYENDPVTNYMDFSWDRCMYKFTKEQSKRMDEMHWLHRAGDS